MTPQTPQNPLSNLKDINTTDILDTSLTWGWWVLIVIGIVAVIAVIRWQVKIYQHKRNVRLLKEQLDALQQSKQSNKIIGVSLLLRRYANYQFADNNINSLSTDDFVRCLNEHIPLDNALKIAFTQSAYQAHNDIDETQLFNYARRWLNV